MRPEKVKHTCSEYCSIDEKGWKIFVVKKKVEVSMSSFILHVVKHTLILHTLCQVWNKLWSFILYVVEKNLEDIFKIFFHDIEYEQKKVLQNFSTKSGLAVWMRPISILGGPISCKQSLKTKSTRLLVSRSKLVRHDRLFLRN